MKLKAAVLLGASLIALFISSCSPTGYSPSAGAPSAGSDAARLEKSRTPWNGPMQEAAPERPGLATGWGDERNSEISYTQFTRASSQPAGTGIIFYNDPEGVEAMTSRKEKVAAMQTAAGEMVEWGVKGRNGFLPTYKEYGYGRRLVAGNKGSSYSIVVKNRCKSALEIVASVDGLDVTDGRTASFSKSGYIIQPGKTLEIEGFRKSESKIAEFEFSSVSGSYANLKHGDTRNVGVIGIAVFTRKGVNPWKWSGDEIQRRGNASPFAEAP